MVLYLNVLSYFLYENIIEAMKVILKGSVTDESILITSQTFELFERGDPSSPANNIRMLKVCTWKTSASIFIVFYILKWNLFELHEVREYIFQTLQILFFILCHSHRAHTWGTGEKYCTTIPEDIYGFANKAPTIWCIFVQHLQKLKYSWHDSNEKKVSISQYW